jgi:hypothetical protein
LDVRQISARQFFFGPPTCQKNPGQSSNKATARVSWAVPKDLLERITETQNPVRVEKYVKASGVQSFVELGRDATGLNPAITYEAE